MEPLLINKLIRHDHEQQPVFPLLGRELLPHQNFQRESHPSFMWLLSKPILILKQFKLMLINFELDASSKKVSKLGMSSILFTCISIDTYRVWDSKK